MLLRSIRFFFLIFSLAFSSSLFAQDNYQQWVNDITSRLDKTAQLVQQGNTDDAVLKCKWLILKCLKI